jgi:hypothetical protein
MRLFYLHGFASSAQSSKAAFFATRLATHGIHLETPDFNEPEFATLTVTRMVGQVCERIDAGPAGTVALIGSSLGGFVAVQTVLARPDRVSRLVLLAPALDFGGNRMRELAVRGVEEWQRTNRLDVFHYGYGRMMPVQYDLYADALRYDALDAVLTIPVQIFQGRRDAAVNPHMVSRWAAGRANVELHMLDDDHQLLASLDDIWREMVRFLGLVGC